MTLQIKFKSNFWYSWLHKYSLVVQPVVTKALAENLVFVSKLIRDTFLTMSFIKSHTSLISFIIKLSESSGAPFHWDNLNLQITCPKIWPNERKKFDRKLSFPALLILVIFCQGLHPQPKMETTSFDKIPCHTVATAFGFSWCFVALLRTKRYEITTYINGLLRLDNEVTKKGPIVTRYKIFQKILWTNVVILFSNHTLLEKLAITYAYSLTIVCIISPFLLLYGVLWSQPCKPTLAGYWMLPECNTLARNSRLIPYISFPLKVFVFVCNQYGLVFITKNLPFVATNIFCVLTVTKYVEIFKSRCVFWNGTGLSIYSPVLLYRKLQVLTIFMNDIMKWGVVSLYIVGASLLLAVSSTVLVRISWVSNNMIVIIFYGYLFIMEMLAPSVLFTLMSKPCTISEKVVKELKKSTGVFVRGSKKWSGKHFLQRVYWSLSIIRVRFGAINFVDSATPLNLVHFANELTVQILLLT